MGKKEDKGAEEARKAAEREEARRKQALEDEKSRREDQARRRGAGLSAFQRTGELGILKDKLGA